MIIKVPIYFKNEYRIKCMKNLGMKMVKAMIKTYNSTECSNETFENVILTKI